MNDRSFKDGSCLIFFIFSSSKNLIAIIYSSCGMNFNSMETFQNIIEIFPSNGENVELYFWRKYKSARSNSPKYQWLNLYITNEAGLTGYLHLEEKLIF